MASGFSNYYKHGLQHSKNTYCGHSSTWPKATKYLLTANKHRHTLTAISVSLSLCTILFTVPKFPRPNSPRSNKSSAEYSYSWKNKWHLFWGFVTLVQHSYNKFLLHINWQKKLDGSRETHIINVFSTQKPFHILCINFEYIYIM